MFPNDEDFRFHLRKSNHVFEMNSSNAKNLMDQGECYMKRNNLNYAVECFQKAYMVASRKGRMDRVVAALQKMGHVKRLQVEQGTHRLLAPGAWLGRLRSATWAPLVCHGLTSE